MVCLSVVHFRVEIKGELLEPMGVLEQAGWAETS